MATGKELLVFHFSQDNDFSKVRDKGKRYVKPVVVTIDVDPVGSSSSTTSLSIFAGEYYRKTNQNSGTKPINQETNEPIITFTPGDITFLYYNELFEHVSMEQSLAVLIRLKLNKPLPFSYQGKGFIVPFSGVEYNLGITFFNSIYNYITF